MFVLGIDTTATVRGVALVDGENILVEYTESSGPGHSVRLIPMVRSVLEAGGRDKRELDAISVTVGPGSYTGVRIGLATVKALAGGLGISVVGVNTLEALAFGSGPRSELVCPLLDARRSRIYTALYRWDGDQVVEVVSPMVSPLAEWLETIRGKRVFFLGEGLVEHGAVIAAAQQDLGCFGSTAALHVRPAAVAILGHRRLARGEGGDPGLLAPQYLANDDEPGLA